MGKPGMDDTRTSLRLHPTVGGRLLDDSLAKRAGKGQAAQSYREHLTAVFDAWSELCVRYDPWIGRVAEDCGVPKERLQQSSLLCVALHDVGKLSENFQRMMRAPIGDEKAYRAAVALNYRHEIIPLWYVGRMAIALALNTGISLPGDGKLEVLAVAGHHQYLQDQYLFDETKFLQVIDWKTKAWDAVKAAHALAEEMFKVHGWVLPVPPSTIPGKKQLHPSEINLYLSNTKDGHPHQCLLRTVRQVSALGSDRHSQFRELFVLLKGLLMTADWMGSGAKPGDEPAKRPRGFVQVPASSLTDYMKAKVDADRARRPEIPPFSDFRCFQKECGQASGHVLAVAPTGSGKTEAGLLWALNQIEAGRARKLIFLLPTMVTANSLYLRMKAFFSKHDHEVALVHSTADLLLSEEEANRADVRLAQLQRSHLFLPVTIATVDQLLATLFHAGRWALKTVAAANAAIVIDEIHAYDPHTGGLVVLLISQLRELGATFLVMSATIPEDLQDTVLQAMESGASLAEPKGITIVTDKDLLDKARNEWSVCKQPLSEWLTARDSDGRPVPSSSIRELLASRNDRDEALRVLIVVNTVQQAQGIARLLLEFDPVCYHSKFVFRDRRDKENVINTEQPRLVVATQVVEVSLDIDYDMLLTECAPFDALVQRAGRVNRTRREKLGRVMVFPFEKGTKKVYGDPPGVLEASWVLCQTNSGALTEKQLTRLTEEAYQGRVLSEVEEFKQIQAATLEQQRRLSGVLDNPHPKEEDLATRLEKYQQMSVIPQPFADEARSVEAWDRRLFEVKMPMWYVRDHKVFEKDDEFVVCDMGYDALLGALMLPTTKENEPACCVI
jgi:CRISPR-associated endonuclease/helicase Cas3